MTTCFLDLCAIPSLVLLFLVLESQLNGLCDDLKKRRGLPIRVNELKGDAIVRGKTYLQKLAGISNIEERLWVKVEDLSRVRNCIVHALGKVESSNDQKRLRELATKGHGLSISNSEVPEQGVLVISPEYCQHAVSDVQELFEAVFEAAGFGPAVSMY